MNRGGPLRTCGRRWPTEDAALHSKLAVTTDATFGQGRCCGWWHEVKAAATDSAADAASLLPPEVAAKLSSYALARIEPQANGCWYWTGPMRSDGAGYGVANLPGGKRDAAHRLVYIQVVEPIPAGMTLDHQCHNKDTSCAGGYTCPHRRCVNPDHVEIATGGDNTRRGKTPPALNLAKDSCPQGHPYTHTDGRGWRKCKTCIDEHGTARRRAAGIPERKLWQSHCSHGHEYTPETTRWSKGNRYCKTCDSDRGPLNNAAKRKPCKGCGGPKEPGGAYRYCAKCRAARAPKPRPAKDTGPSRKVRSLVYARDGHACVCCGQSVIGRPHSIGHRIRRSQGGTNEMPNLLTFLGLGNGLFPGDHHFRIDSRQDPHDHAKGYQLESWQDPAAEGVMYSSPDGSGITAWLEPDGGLSFEDPALVTGGAA